MSHPLYVVDVFAERKYAGNQLAVVEDAADLGDETMLAITRETNYSEATFVESTSPTDGAWDVRIFTPGGEIPFAGHPTLGTAYVIREHLADDPGDEVVLNLGVGRIPVRVEEVDGEETLWMSQRTPEFGEELAHDDLAEVLGLDADQLDDEWPVQVVSTGLPTIVVPLVDRAALTDIDLDRAAYDAVTGDRDAKNVLAFCPDPHQEDNDLAVRTFAPGHGVPEDPATGSSNGCLAAYLARHRFFGDASVSARVEQGYELDRPSLLHLEAEDDGDSVAVEVGGSVVPVVEGRLL
ncbi:phenazine biosynthesis protein [Halobacteriales archaeon QS_1_68_20]|nr:MAG: phenazine biosynthesis protein [Halobacteriales archaeon QS_1_68_20]